MNDQYSDPLDRLKALVGQVKLAAERRDGEALPELVSAYLDASAAVINAPSVTGNPDAVVLWRQRATEVLQLQRDVEQIASPWMDDLRILLRENRKGQALSNTYRAEP